jgi:hypothetical protein
MTKWVPPLRDDARIGTWARLASVPSMSGTSVCRIVRSGLPVGIRYRRTTFARLALVPCARVVVLAHRYLSARPVYPGWRHAACIFRKLRQLALLLQNFGPSLQAVMGPELAKNHCSSVKEHTGRRARHEGLIDLTYSRAQSLQLEFSPAGQHRISGLVYNRVRVPNF